MEIDSVKEAALEAIDQLLAAPKGAVKIYHQTPFAATRDVTCRKVPAEAITDLKRQQKYAVQRDQSLQR